MLLLVGWVATAGAGEQSSASVTTSYLPPPEKLKPYIQGAPDAQVRVKLTVAFRIAAQRLRDDRECAQLFTDVGADALGRLRATRYESVADTGGDRVCGRGLGAAAFTMVRSPRTIVCPAFNRLTVEDAAVIVLHEALHFAGQTEWPLDPNAPNAGQINRMVRAACGL